MAPRERYTVTWDGTCCEIPVEVDDLILRMQCDHPAEFIANAEMAGVVFETERKRGYDYEGFVHSPGYFTVEMSVGQEVTFTASTETREVMDTLEPAHAQDRAVQRRRALLQRSPSPLRTGTPARLVLAADQFLFRPPNRRKDQIWARAAGDQVRSVIAGYLLVSVGFGVKTILEAAQATETGVGFAMLGADGSAGIVTAG